MFEAVIGCLQIDKEFREIQVPVPTQPEHVGCGIQQTKSSRERRVSITQMDQIEQVANQRPRNRRVDLGTTVTASNCMSLWPPSNPT